MFNIYEIIMLFFLFSLIGWIWEVILALFQYKKFVNRGFLIGPCLPIYGFGGLIATIFFSKLDIFNGIFNIVFIFIGTTLLCSILEYFTSWLMEKLFNNRWWDYSNIPLNLNGRICLFCSCGFGLGCTSIILFINPLIRALLDNLSVPINIIRGLDLLFILILILDTTVSFKIINNFKNISNSIVEDSTDKITTLVKKTILNNYNIFYQRIINSFPNMQIQNKLSLLRNRILDEQKRIEKATYKLDIRKRKVKQLEKELFKSKSKGIKNIIINFFKKK